MKKINTNNSELEQLKKLLLESELEKLEELEKKINLIKFESYDQESILNKITPLFDRLLLDSLQAKYSKTTGILSVYVAQIIARSSKHDAKALSESLQSIISPAIKKEIEDNRDGMVDTFYPIIGNIVSKYVTQAIKELMETINKNIESGLSFSKYKRKVKAKISGVSETELLLEESHSATIYSFLVIQKDTGLLIADAHLDNKKIEDPHMVASMASAMKDFINDWVDNNTSSREVQILSYGDATLYIESAGSAYIIAFLNDEPDRMLRREINKYFGSLVDEYASFFANFDGDDSVDEVKDISKNLYTQLNKLYKVDNKEKKSSNTLKYIFIFISLLLIMYGLNISYKWYGKHQLLEEIYAKTAQKIIINREDNYLTLIGQVDSIEKSHKIESIVKNNSKLNIQNNLSISLRNMQNNMNLIKEEFKNEINSTQSRESENYNELKEQISQILTKIDSLKKEKNKLKYILNSKYKMYSLLDEKLKDNICYNSLEHSLDTKQLNLFTASSSNLNSTKMNLFKDSLEKYFAIISNYKEYVSQIVIEGYSDSSGRAKDNMDISQERATTIKIFIENMDIIKKSNMSKLLEVKAFGSSKIVFENDIEDKNASRRVEVKVILDNRKVLNKLKRIIGD